MSEHKSETWRHCVVVGAGLLGASLAGAGKARGLFERVTGVGRSQGNLETAKSRGFLDAATSDLAAACADADLVVLATPVRTALEQLAEVAAAVSASCVITDVGSVKGPIVAEARRLGLAGRFLGAHPLAGKAESGAGAADIELFRGARVVLTPCHVTSARLRERMRSLWLDLDAHVLEMSAAEHDEALATSSHLPQMVAYVLSAAADAAPARERIVELAASGFRDTTRLAASDPDMWTDIAGLNRVALLSAIDDFAVLWTKLRQAVDRSDEVALRSLIDAARRLRKEVAP